MSSVTKGLWSDERGQGMAEYGLIIALVAIVVIGAVLLLGKELGSTFSDIVNGLKGRK